MLKQLTLRNFRCFDRHTVPLRPTSIVVGRNNAGKSTLVEALRLVSHVVNRYGNFAVREVPDWLDLARLYRGVAPSMRGMEFNAETLYHRYGDPPARVTASFDSGDRVEIYVGGEPTDPEMFAVVFDAGHNVVTRRHPAERMRLSRVSILPQVAPLSRSERVLDDQYVRGAIGSSLTSLHFRNQVRLFPEFWEDFRRIAEQTWPGLQVQGLSSTDRGQLVEPLMLMIRDGDFVAEVSRMGHGLQMWLQTMWFLARTRDDKTIILDEPDVYMHADLQRRLVRFLKGRGQQVIVATHSIEIMAEVAPDDVLVIDRARPSSSFAASLPAVQEVADRIGGIHNFQLARLWTSRRCLLVEGKDIGFLRAIHATLFPTAAEPLDAIPRLSLGGWSGFPYAIGSRMLLQNSGGDQIIPYCILDRDYHTSEEVDERYEAARRSGVQLHIWRRKEIENYVLIPSAIVRFVDRRQREAAEQGGRHRPAPTLTDVTRQLDSIAEQLRDAATDGLANEIYQRNRDRGLQYANSTARAIVIAGWTSGSDRWGLLSGKEMWAQLSRWSQAEYGVPLSAMAVARVLVAEEVVAEMRGVLTAIEETRPFRRR